MIRKPPQPPPFLRDPDVAFRWATRNADVSVDEPYEAEEIMDRCHAYCRFARSAYTDGSVTIYRVVEIPRQLHWRDGVRLRCLGKAWSKEREGADSYNEVPHRVPTRKVLLVGETPVSAIDWSYGFTSFLYYGESQWEVSLKSRKTVLLTEVDGERLDPPLRGSTGDAKESWEDCV